MSKQAERKPAVHQTQIPDGLTPTDWKHVYAGQTVYIDNYENGKYPNANPRISGPCVVVSPAARTLAFPTSPHTHQMMHYSNNLLIPTANQP